MQQQIPATSHPYVRTYTDYAVSCLYGVMIAVHSKRYSLLNIYGEGSKYSLHAVENGYMEVVKCIEQHT